LSREDGILFSYMQGSAGWPGLRNHLYSYILDWVHCCISRAWWERGEVKEVRGWGDRAPSTGLVHALHTTGDIWKGEWMCLVVGSEVQRTWKHGLGVKTPVCGGVRDYHLPTCLAFPLFKLALE
jgi:hypothetical protein